MDTRSLLFFILNYFTDPEEFDKSFKNPKNNLKLKNQATSVHFRALSDPNAKIKIVVFITVSANKSHVKSYDQTK